MTLLHTLSMHLRQVMHLRWPVWQKLPRFWFSQSLSDVSKTCAATLHKRVFSTQVNLAGVPRSKYADILPDVKPATHDALFRCVHRHELMDVVEFDNVGSKKRADLATRVHISIPSIIHRDVSGDGTIKWVMRCHEQQKLKRCSSQRFHRKALSVGCCVCRHKRVARWLAPSVELVLKNQ